MKILMIAPQPFFEPRGTPISVQQRLYGLSALEYEIDLITYHVGKDLDIPGVTIHRTPSIKFIKSVKIGPSLTKLFLDILIFFKAFFMLITNRYDVIHSHEEASFFSIILAAMFRTPHLYDMHSNLSQQLENSNFGRLRPAVRLFEVLEKWVINTCDAVITIGTDLEEQVRKINPSVKHTRLENLPIRANSEIAPQVSSDKLKAKLGLIDKLPIVYTGTFETYQGLDLLFESIKVVKQYCPEVVFVLVGGKPQQVEYWQDKARKHDLEECTLFAGTVSPEEALTYLEMGEILVSPRTDGLSVPLKIYTYLSSGKPTVATKLFAHTQILNDDLAVLVEPESNAFAEGILRLIQDPDLRQQLGLQAKEFASEKYNPANYLAKLEQIYQNFRLSSRTLQVSKHISERPMPSIES